MKNEDIFLELGNIDPELIDDAAPGERKLLPFRQRPAFKRLIACAASVLLVVGVLTMVGFDNVSAAMRQLVSFIPGVGIEPAGSVIYTLQPITGKLENGDDSAQVFRATYSGGQLSVTVQIDGRSIYNEQFHFYRNGVLVDLQGGESPYYSLATSSDSSMIDFAIPMEAPDEEDRFEVEIDGFEGRLAFTMRPCETYEDLQEIGPTVTRNGISVTATAHRNGNELVVWCYETRDESATDDLLCAFGMPGNGSNVVMKYVETESGKLFNSASGWVLVNRSVYQLADTDTTATLHIPYLSMYREEKGKAKISLPKSYGMHHSDIAIETSLGEILITSVERKPSGSDPNEDIILLEFAYENRREEERIYHFSYEIDGKMSGAMIADPEAGVVRYIEVLVDKDETKLDFSISGIEYYLMGEYEIELDIQ